MCQYFSANFTALLDTGSALSLLQAAFAKKLQVKIKPPNPTHPKNLLNASNQLMQIIGTAQISLKIGGLLFPTEFLIINDLSYRCLLGRDFCNSASVTIDFGNKSVSLCDNVIAVNIL